MHLHVFAGENLYNTMYHSLKGNAFPVVYLQAYFYVILELPEESQIKVVIVQKGT